jgi:hypothetical protein
MDNSLEVQPGPPELPWYRNPRLLLVLGLLVLALLGGVAYVKILTSPVEVPALVNSEPTPDQPEPTSSVYEVADLIDYTLPPDWTVERSRIITNLEPVTVIGYGLRFTAPPSKRFESSSVQITIKRYPKSETQLESMQEIVNKMNALYPGIYGLEQTTFAGQQAVHFWGDRYQALEQYVVLENGGFDHLWYINVIYLGNADEFEKVKELYGPQVKQIFNSIQFK